eukprot:2007496-Amphidinium_carterae.1
MRQPLSAGAGAIEPSVRGAKRRQRQGRIGPEIESNKAHYSFDSLWPPIPYRDCTNPAFDKP